MENIALNKLLHFSDEDFYKYKLHLAAYNGETHPLDVFARDFDEWIDWNQWRGGKNDFNRQYIFSLIQDYHRPNKYVFGGIFEVIERYDDYEDTTVGYKVVLSEDFKELIGRLIVELTYDSHRGRAFRFESYIDYLFVSEITEKPYEGVEFPGYDNVLIDFPTLEILARNQKTDWRVALQNQKGIYVIVDKKNGKKYVGSAYNDCGIWSRWCCYAGTAHGGNDALVELIEKEGIEYARNNFQLSILEVWPMKTDDETIINRESFWKEVLLTRGEFGYNNN